MAGKRRGRPRLTRFTKGLVQHARKVLKSPAKRKKMSSRQRRLFEAVVKAGPGPNPRYKRR